MAEHFTLYEYSLVDGVGYDVSARYPKPWVTRIKLLNVVFPENVVPFVFFLHPFSPAQVALLCFPLLSSATLKRWNFATFLHKNVAFLE